MLVLHDTYLMRTFMPLRHLSRVAAETLLKMAKAAGDPDLAAKLLQAAADLKERAGELPAPSSNKAPDVQTGR